MALTPEQVLSAHKANIDAVFGLTSKAFEGVEKLIELNVNASRAALNEAAAHSQALAGAKDVQELVNLQTAYFQPLAEKAAAYNRHIFNIASSTSAELQKALEEKAGQYQQSFNSLVEATAKNAPAGSESAVAMVKSAVSAANNAFESVQKAVKQASDLAEANIKAVTTATTAPSAKK
jgi:phasin family protein